MDEPARLLWLAVLFQAGDDLTSPAGDLQQDALYWLESESETTGSFNWVCEQLGIDFS